MKYELINPNAKSDNIIGLVFENRNIDEQSIFDYIECSRDFRSSPFDYINMQEGIDLITKHILKFSDIGILVDCDCDGYMAATICYKLLKELEPELNIKFITHKDKRHGLYDDMIEHIKENVDIDFLIIPDAGSNQVEEIKKVMDLGIEVLVIDHHDAPISEEVIIVNNQFNDINKGLSGAAMVLKLAEAMIREKADKYIDLAAISLISDSMPMNNLENRYYVKRGLQNINNKFIKEILVGIDEPSTYDVSFKISPIINAIVRMGSVEDKEILIKALIDEEGEVDLPTRKNGKKRQMYNYIDAAIKIAKWRRDEQKTLVNNEVEKIAIEHEDPVNIILLEDEFNNNISGYFANVVSSKNLKPTLAIKYDKEDDCYRGSARGCEIQNFKDFLESSNLVKCEGHQGAFGITELKRSNIEDLKTWLRNTQLPTETVYKVDSIMEAKNIEKSDISAINSLKNIWGKNIEEPLFAIKLKDATIKFIGAAENTLRITKGGITYIKFNCNEKEVNELKSIDGMVDIDIIGSFDVNIFNGYANYQVKIKDYEVKQKSKVNDELSFEDLYF